MRKIPSLTLRTCMQDPRWETKQWPAFVAQRLQFNACCSPFSPVFDRVMDRENDVNRQMPLAMRMLIDCEDLLSDNLSANELPRGIRP